MERLESSWAHCEAAKCRLKDLTLEELQSACDLIEEDVYQVLGTENAMKALQSYGSGGEQPVADRVASWKKALS